MAQRALRQGVVLAPGAVFAVSAAASDFMRFNEAQMANARVFTVVADVVRERE